MTIASLHVTIVSPIAAICTRTEYGALYGVSGVIGRDPGQRQDHLLAPGSMPWLECLMAQTSSSILSPRNGRIGVPRAAAV